MDGAALCFLFVQKAVECFRIVTTVQQLDCISDCLQVHSGVILFQQPSLYILGVTVSCNQILDKFFILLFNLIRIESVHFFSLPVGVDFREACEFDFSISPLVKENFSLAVQVIDSLNASEATAAAGPLAGVMLAQEPHLD
mgnify:CR=1 FL=1